MGSKPELTEEGVMVFRPTMKEFRDFQAYVTYMESCGAHKYGIAKVIPPREWSPKADLSTVGDMVIQSPTSQLVTGKGGLFQQFNIPGKAMTVQKHKELAMSNRYAPPKADNFEELERKYWKNVSFNQPIYGADMPGTLTDPAVKVWNINCLPSVLDELQRKGVSIPGVNTAYLYFGMWKTSFAWHTEDMDLYSINYLHHGAPKAWYAIPPEHGKRLESLATGFFPGSFQTCPCFLRHKMTIISPNVLKKYSIPFRRMLQKEGEFMITFPYGYHAGFNCGYNIAESTNFALDRWIEFGQKATRCYCRADTVKIDMNLFSDFIKSRRGASWTQYAGRMRSGATRVSEEDEETETDDQHPPSTKRAISSSSKNAGSKAAAVISVSSPPPSPCKGKRRSSDDNLEEESVPQKKRARRAPSPKPQLPAASSNSAVRKKKAAMKAAMKAASDVKTEEEASLAVAALPVPVEELAPSPAPVTPPRQHHDVPQPLQADFSISDTPVDDVVGLWQHQPRIPAVEVAWNKYLSQDPKHCAVCTNIQFGMASGVREYIKKHLKLELPPLSVETCSVAEASNSSGSMTATCTQSEERRTPSPALSPIDAESPMDLVNQAVLASNLGEDDDDVYHSALSEDGALLDWSKDSNDHNYAKLTSNGADSTRRVRTMSTSSVSLQDGSCQLGKSESDDACLPPLTETVEESSSVKSELPERLTCQRCSVCVHPGCYGVVKAPANVSAWLCARCESSVCNEDVQDCCLCAMRGGALKKTDDGRWAHILCAISMSDVRFGDLATRQPIVLKGIDPGRREENCHYCQLYGRPQKCGSCVQCAFGDGNCKRYLHITCLYRPVARIVQGNWPRVLSPICHRHAIEDGDRRAVDFAVGEVVYAKHKNHRYYKANVCDIARQLMYEIMFDDNTYSSNMLPEDIVNRDCVRLGPPCEGTAVEVMWTDGQTYGGKFVRSRCEFRYKVIFEDQSRRKLEKQFVYGFDEDLPKKVRSKLTVCDDKEDDHSSPPIMAAPLVVEGKRNRRPSQRFVQ